MGKAGMFEKMAYEEDDEGPARSIEGWVLIASGVHEEAQEDDVYEAFAEFGDIKNHHLYLDRRTSFVKGYSFIEYESKREAESAIRGMNHTMLLDSKLSVGWAFGKAPSKRDNVRSRAVVSAIGASSNVVSAIGGPAEAP